MRIGQSRKIERRHVRVIVKIFPDSFSLGGKSDSPKDKAISSDNQETGTSTKEASIDPEKVQCEEQEDGQQDPEVQYDEDADDEHNDKNSTPTLNRSVHLN